MGRVAILLACALFSSCALAQDPQPPTHVIARAHTVNQIMITWRDPDVPGGRAPPRGRLYLINFRATHPWQTSFQEEQADEAWGALENLSPFTRYEIFINIVQDGRVSEPSELVAVTTVVLEAKGSPTSVPIIESVEEYGGYDTVNGLIRWTTKNDPDNELTGHIIFYTEVDSAEYSQSYMSWPIKRIDGKDTRAVIEGLKPETQYGFIVQAFNAMGGGPISMVYYYKTPSRRRGPGVVDVDSATTGKCPPGVREVKCPVDPCENSQCPHYRCKANFCGGCNAEHFDIFGKKVECQSQAVQHGCRPGVEIVNCGRDPCDKAKCPKYPNAQCRSNYCGGCNADFYDIYGNKVDCRLGVSNRDNDYYGCPPGVAIVACRVDPCLAATCPRYPNARCKFNFCGGCNTEFFGDDGSPVECGNGGTHSSSQCPLGVPLINCVRNPCDGASCAANPSARCKPNYCGDCKAEFFDGNGNQVSCDIQVTPEKPGECPAVSGSSFGTCAELCSSDDDCQSDYKCCSNGCGHKCKPPAEKPGSCPGIDATRNIYGVCAEKCGSDYDCAGDEKCCSNGCGHVCLNAEETMREKPGTCPVVDGGPVGVCAEMCTIDQECPGDQKCCSNGCGHVCTVVGLSQVNIDMAAVL
ncbi:uncharacterized protein [Ptychodera flava]|uniref:uncharacterized protein n=1 Tax=Ptychodera flava TaxID=63121 RepID=UPI00396AAAEF